MFARLSPEALIDLSCTHERELLALPICDGRSLSPRQRADMSHLFESHSSCFAGATAAYLRRFEPALESLDSPADPALAPYAASTQFEICADHLAWLELVGAREQYVSLYDCDLATALEAIRRFCAPHIRVERGLSAALRSGGTLDYCSDSLLVQAVSYARLPEHRAALAEFAWSVSEDEPRRERWLRVVKPRTP